MPKTDVNVITGRELGSLTVAKQRHKATDAWQLLASKL